MKLCSKKLIPLTGIMSLLMVPVAAFAGYEIEFLSDVYDFGVMKEAAGPQTGSVSIVNHGPDATYIREVRPSCGCTGADFQKGVINQGDTAWISFTYDPKGRPGPFDKTVRVTIGDEVKRHSIKIRGNVIGTPETLSTIYPVEMGPLRLTQRQVDLGKVRSGESRHLFVNAYNQTPDSLRLSVASSSPALEAAIYPPTIGPADVATVSLYFATRELPADAVGKMDVTVNMTDSQTGASIGSLLVKANVEPDSEALDAKGMADAPRLETGKSVIALEKVAPGKRRTFSIKLENTGGSRLRIINIKSDSDLIEIGKFPTDLKAGGHTVVKCKLTMPADAKTPLRLPIHIYSSDPLHPLQTIHITALPESSRHS